MFKKYSELLAQETLILKAALEAEKEKRRSIFAADGKKLQALTEKSSILMEEVREIASKRERLFVGYAREHYLELSGPVTLTQFCLLTDEKAPELSQDTCRIVDEYRNTAFKLKQETEENGRRLTDARDTIHKLLESLSSDDDSTYNNSGKASQDKIRKKYTGSVVVNANA
ncbi:MAG: flagellar protein FlgN [Spirochaetia bacterium]|nr:flagellar protein FlgN [Spirochaetia bacterium]